MAFWTRGSASAKEADPARTRPMPTDRQARERPTGNLGWSMEGTEAAGLTHERPAASVQTILGQKRVTYEALKQADPTIGYWAY